MILSSEAAPADAQQMLEFYKQHFAVVDLVMCGKCGSMLAFECSGGEGMGLAPNELGKYVIPIGDDLLSHRVRLDEAPTGERMVGYQCGHPVPNPLFPAAKKTYEEALADYDKDYEDRKAKAIKAHEKLVAQSKKQGEDEPPKMINPEYAPPVMADIPEMIPCGNDTRIGDIERGKVPVGAMQTALSPFEKHQIREKIKADRKYKPDFKKVGNTKHFETFAVERIV